MVFYVVDFGIFRFYRDDACARVPSTDLHGELPDPEFSFGGGDPFVACQNVMHIFIL